MRVQYLKTLEYLAIAVIFGTSTLSAEDIEVQGLDFGMGYNTLEGTVLHTALTYPALQPQRAKGQTTSFELTEIDDLQSLSEAMSLSAGAKATYSGISVAGSVDLSSLKKVSKYSYSLLLHVNVMNQLIELPDTPVNGKCPIVFTESARQLLSQGDFKKFEQAYGDSYVRGVYDGAEFYALFSTDLESQEDQQHLKQTAEVKGGAGAISGELTEAYQHDMTSLLSHGKHTVRIFKTGGLGDIPVDTEPLIKYAQGFPEMVRKNEGMPYKYFMERYTAVPDFPKPNTALIDQIQACIKDWTKKSNSLYSMLNDIDYVLDPDHHLSFNQVDFVDLNRQRGAVSRTLDDINRRCVELLDHPEKAEQLLGTGFEWPQINLPLLRKVKCPDEASQNNALDLKNKKVAAETDAKGLYDHQQNEIDSNQVNINLKNLELRKVTLEFNQDTDALIELRATRDRRYGEYNDMVDKIAWLNKHKPAGYQDKKAKIWADQAAKDKMYPYSIAYLDDPVLPKACAKVARDQDSINTLNDQIHQGEALSASLKSQLQNLQSSWQHAHDEAEDARAAFDDIQRRVRGE